MIEILLATYNGEKYLSQQLDSILSQTYKDYHITIRDDGSSDNTMQIINNYISKFPLKITLLKDNLVCKTPCLNFLTLMKNCKSQYIALCDQDDVWKRNKLFLEYSKMKDLERINGINTPLLVHSDLSITDKNLDIKHKSFIKYKKLTRLSNINRLLTENNITGCTCLFNKALLEFAIYMPKQIKIHDWWIGLIASCFGETGFINKPLVLYRQHNQNVIGASNTVTNVSDIKQSINYSYSQAKKMLLMFSEQMPVLKFKIIAIYCCFPIESKLYRIRNILFKGYQKNRLIKIIGQLIFC